MSKSLHHITGMSSFLALLVGCSDDDDDLANADSVGVAAVCAMTTDCPEVEIGDERVQLDCLTQFSGGYCAIEGCSSAVDCPSGATCVAHNDGKNYCFRECVEKLECNENRPADEEANCSSNFDYAAPGDEKAGVKACVPPSSGE